MVAGQYIALFKADFPVLPLAVDRCEVVLKIRVRYLIVAKDKSPHLPDVRGANAGAGGQPLKTYTEFFERLRKGVQGDRFFAVKGTVDTEVILQILAHAGQVDLRCDIQGLLGIGRADAREHEQLRALYSAATDNDFFRSEGLGYLTIDFIFNAARPAVFNNQFSGKCSRLQS